MDGKVALCPGACYDKSEAHLEPVMYIDISANINYVGICFRIDIKVKLFKLMMRR